MMKLLLASENKHKAIEIKELFDELIPDKIQLLLPVDLSEDIPEVIEDGDSFIANSFIKAKAFYGKYHMPVIADDSGLETAALNGRPGINSARFAGTHGDDAANRKQLLNEMKGISNRNANFTAVLCYYDGNNPIYFEGKVFGNITDAERGNGGFGYDPVFIPEGYEETFAEMPQSKKNKISHRSMALKRFCEWIAGK